jgi:alpha-galactosidase
MVKQQFDIVYAQLRLLFWLDEQNHLRLVYAGENKKALLPPEDAYEQYHFVEVEVNGENVDSHHGMKHCSTFFGVNAHFVSFEKEENAFGLLLKIVTEDATLRVTTFFQFYKTCKAIQVHNEVENIATEPLDLLFVSSFYLVGLGTHSSGNAYQKMAFWTPHNSWHCEAQWTKDSFIHLGLYNGNDVLSMKRIVLNNTGTWSTKEYLPMAIVEDRKRHELILSEIENNGSWHLEVGDERNTLYLSAGGPTFVDNLWRKRLAPQERFVGVSCSASFGSSFEEVIQEITKYRRLVRHPFPDDETLPLIYNDYMHALWDKQTEELIKPLVNGAGEMGCEEFCIDAGWFHEGSDWWKDIGDWEEEAKNFPHGGLKATLAYIHSKGMKAGLWIEIESVGENSSFYKKAKPEYFFTAEGKKVFQHSRHQLDFANPEVYLWAKKTIERLMSLYDLDYLKTDYNTDMGPGNELQAASLGDGLLKHNRAYLRFIDEIEEEFPTLTIENCASGGCRMDEETLKRFPIQSTSDQTNCHKYPYLSAAVLSACTPEQAAVWCYPVDTFVEAKDITEERVVLNVVNAMLGRIHLASDIAKLTPPEKALLKEGMDYYKKTRSFKRNALPIYPKGISHFFAPEVVGGLQDEKRIMLAVWNTSDKARTIRVSLKKYGIRSLRLAYPSSLKTDYSFDPRTGILEVRFPEAYTARLFDSGF